MEGAYDNESVQQEDPRGLPEVRQGGRVVRTAGTGAAGLCQSGRGGKPLFACADSRYIRAEPDGHHGQEEQEDSLSL